MIGIYALSTQNKKVSLCRALKKPSLQRRINIINLHINIIEYIIAYFSIISILTLIICISGNKNKRVLNLHRHSFS